MQSDWQLLQIKLSERFGSPMDYDSILFVIGLQELNKPYRKYKKDEKLEVMHIALCTLLEPFGFYEYNPLYDNLSQKGARFVASLIFKILESNSK
jgi:hypothetical protein